MNQEQRYRRAARLFDAIGDIDDRYIAEAEAPYASKKASGILWKRLLPVALSLTVVVGGAYLALTRGMLANKSAPEAADRDFMADNANDAEEGGPLEDTSASTVSLHRLLASIRDRIDVPAYDGASSELWDGTSYLIWKYENEALYRRIPLSEEQESALVAEISRGTGTALTESVSIRVWIVEANGTVLTPYLSDGGAQQGTLFDYTPEVNPSTALTQIIIHLLT